jgi:hypothetical protein
MKTLSLFLKKLLSGKPYNNRLLTWSVFFPMVILFMACKPYENTTINPLVTVPGNFKTIYSTMGYYHSPEFRTYTFLPGQGEMKVQLGASSASLLSSIYPKIFANAQLVYSTTGNTATGFDFILEPQIESFLFTRDDHQNVNWTKLVYRFTLYNRDGQILTSWNTVGWSFPNQKTSPTMSLMVSESIEQATKKFIESFEQVPEVNRCISGQSLDGVTAPEEMQDLISVKLGDDAITSAYNGIVTAKIQSDLVFSVPSFPSSHKFGKGRIGVIAPRLFLKNEGNNTLYLDPLNISWLPVTGREISPISPAPLTNSLAPKAELDYDFDWTALLSLAINIAIENENEKKEVLYRTYFGQNLLGENYIAGNSTLTGTLYFPVKKNEILSGELRIPVIDLDTATRYIIRFPITRDPQTMNINFD